MRNAVSVSFAVQGVTPPPTRPDPTRPITTYDPIHRHLGDPALATMDDRFAAIGGVR